MSKIYEKDIKKQMIELLQDLKKEEMNQFIFEDDFSKKVLEEIKEKDIENNNKDKKEQEVQNSEKINLMDYNKIFNS